MGRTAKELFHWWDGQRLEKLEARKRIYVPLYIEQVVKTEYFQEIRTAWNEMRQDKSCTLYLMDFDAYQYGEMSLSQVLNNPLKSMGHGFVLAMLLKTDAALEECELRKTEPH